MYGTENMMEAEGPPEIAELDVVKRWVSSFENETFERNKTQHYVTCKIIHAVGDKMWILHTETLFPPTKIPFLGLGYSESIVPYSGKKILEEQHYKINGN